MGIKNALITSWVFYQYFNFVLAGLTDNGTRLDITQESYSAGTTVLRSGLGGDRCQLKTLTVWSVQMFVLTPDDVNILKHCPLTTLILQHTACFVTSSRVDFSTLPHLETLWLSRCGNTEFVITALPASIRELNIEDLTEDNFQLGVTNGGFGKSLEVLQVEDTTMCCPAWLTQTFGKQYTQVECQFWVFEWLTFKCGLSNNGTELVIASPGEVPILRQELAVDCRLNLLYVKLPGFKLTKQDLDILGRCPLKELILYDSQCLSADAGDLKQLSSLTYLFMLSCRRSDFVITSLPASLQAVRLDALTEFNVRLTRSEGGDQFGDSLTELMLYSGAMCCETTVTYLQCALVTVNSVVVWLLSNSD